MLNINHSKFIKKLKMEKQTLGNKSPNEQQKIHLSLKIHLITDSRI